MSTAIPVVKGTRAAGREAEGGRRPTEDSLPAAARPSDTPVVPDSEVEGPTTRRRLTVAYKLKVLNRIEDLRKEGNGSVGAYLRAEGLYYSSVQKWMRQNENGSLGIRSRGARIKGREALMRENKALRRQNEGLKKRLHKTEIIVDLQKKISEMMNLDNPEIAQTNGKAF